MTTAPFGSWTSPISAERVARAGVRLGQVALTADGAAWWSESRPDEGGRSAVVRRPPGGEVADVLPAGWNARTRVHEYGGAAWLGLDDGRLVFAEWDDQRLHLVEPGAQPRPLTPQPERPQGDRYADLVLGPDGASVLCVRERATGDGPADVARDLVRVPLDGSAVGDPSLVRSLVTDEHFLSNPRVAPGGRHLAWLTWDHPDMPWDATRLRVAELAPDGSVGQPRTVVGGPSESVFQPEWAGPDALYAVSDRTGWWNLYAVPLDGEPRALCPREEEFGAPAWQFGYATYGVLGDGRLAVTSGVGEARLSVLDPETGALEPVDLGQELDWSPVLRVGGSQVLGVVGSPTTAPSVVLVDLSDGAGTAGPQLLRRSLDDVPDPEWLPQARLQTFAGTDANGGREVHAVVYPPRSPDFSGPDGERPPYVAFVHGGPTSATSAVLDVEAAYFTSRGIGVVDVNYGGSTGYGRAYRERLRGQWGVVDVQDVAAAVQQLAASGDADGDRLLIRGGSAGGWTVLAALTGTDVFAGGTSYYGVAELVDFAADTHDFESRYLDGLVGPLPEARDTYVERAPLSHVDELSCPVLLLQGLEDKVVPPSQAEVFVEALQRLGLPYAYLAFEGEQHGFRKAGTVVAALEAELSFYGQVCGFEARGVPVLELSRGSD